MDLLMSMVTMMKDLNSVDRQYRNLNLQLKYALEKANLTLNKYSEQIQEIAFMVKNLKTTVKQAQILTKKLDQLLNTQSIAIKDKIRLSLPFNQTKSQVIFVIQTLQKIINDIKNQSIQQSKGQNKQGGVKRKTNDNLTFILEQQPNKSTKNQLTVSEIDEQVQEVYMGPTVQEDQVIFSQSHKKKNEVEFIISIKGFKQVIEVIEKQQNSLLETKLKLEASGVEKEQILYTVARLNFQKVYKGLKEVTKDIDRISTKSHFHIVVKKNSEIKPNQKPFEHDIGQYPTHQSSAKSKARPSNSQRQDQQAFFSFPTDKYANQFPFTLYARKQDPSKLLYKEKGGQWIKIEQNEIEILTGSNLAAFINPVTKEPSIYFQIKYQLEEH